MIFNRRRFLLPSAAVLMILIVILAPVAIRGKDGSIQVSTLKAYENATGDKKIKEGMSIIKDILLSAGKTDFISRLSRDMSLFYTYGNVLGDKEDEVIFVVKAGSKNTFVVVYQKDGEQYKFATIVDEFFLVKDLQLIPVKETQRNIIVIREEADQMLGAFETDTFIRGYIYNNSDDEHGFDLVLNIVEDSKAYYNELWDKKPAEEAHWLRVAQKGNALWENNHRPNITLVSRQNYAVSNETGLVNIPDDQDFDIVSSRDVVEKYYWNSNWNHFIISEAIYSKTGEKVAIIEDLSNSPFSLVNENAKYRIKLKDGTTDVVPKADVKDIKPASDIVRI